MTTLTSFQTFIIILMLMLGTQLTRFLSFIIFPAEKATPPFIIKLGKVLPYAVIGLLVVYCLKGVNIFSPQHGLPEFIAITAIVILHLWKKNTLLSIGVGTGIYMILVQTIFR